MIGKIILIESDVELSAVLEEVLRHSGYTVMIVGTSKGELGLIHSASAVILDVDTTAADKELARLSLLQLRRETLPIVLMGVQVPENLDQRLKSHSIRLQSKHVVWVQKPFRNEELLAAVRQAQEGCVSEQANGTTPQTLWGKHDALKDRRRP